MRFVTSLAVIACLATAPTAMAQIIGIDFNTVGGATIPQWTEMTEPGTVNNLVDDTGMPTAVSFTVNTGANFATTPSAATVPSHSYPLGGIANYFFSTTPAVMTFRGLDPSIPYDVWAFGLRGFTMNNAVTITGATQVSFNQVTTTTQQLWVNDSAGSSAQTLDDYAILLFPSAAGEITFNVDITPGGGAGWTIAGVAIRPIPEPATAGLLGIAGMLLLRRRD